VARIGFVLLAVIAGCRRPPPATPAEAVAPFRTPPVRPFADEPPLPTSNSVGCRAWPIASTS
jgi:hypothetical protein